MSERGTGGWLGKYDLIAELPREGAEDVYLAAAVAPGGYTQLAVIRALRPTLAADGTLASRFLSAAKVGARLNHANIVETFEVAQEAGETFAAMEYLEGQPLARIVERIGAKDFSRGMWLRILVDVLAGLHHAHEALDDGGLPLHLAHLRLTSARVFVTYDGQVKVLDFGKLEAQETSERAKSLARKIATLAPEQARGEPADLRADVFAVGAMLWEAASRVPFWGDLDDKAILTELAAGRVPSLRKVDPSVPGPLADIVGRALAANPDDRYSTAMHMQTDLEGFLRASGDSPAPREIGRMVAHAFLEERLRTTTIVDEQLRRLRARALSTGDDEEDEPVSLLRLETAPPPSSGKTGEPMRTVPTSPRPIRPVGVVGAGAEASTEDATVRGVRSLRAPAAKGRRIAWIAGGAALVVILAVLAVVTGR